MTRILKIALLGVLGALAACSSETAGDAPATAVDDSLEAPRGLPVQTGNVLANDADPEGRPLEVIGWTDGASGAVTYLGEGVFSYTPNASIASGTDAFTYTITDGGGNLSTGTVHVALAAGWGRPDVQDAHYLRNVSSGLSSYYSSATATPALVESSSGDLTMAWVAPDGSAVFGASRDHLTGAWSGGTRLDGEGAGTRSAPVLVVSGSGEVTAIWSVNIAGGSVWASKMAPGGAWSAAVRLDLRAAGSFSGVKAVVDAQGAVTAVWRYYDGTRLYQLWSSRAAAGADWSPPVKVSFDEATGSGVTSASGWALAGDPAGDVLVAWVNSDGSRGNVWANRMTTTGSWGTAGKIEIDESSSVPTSSLLLFMDSTGAATVFWRLYAATYQLWHARLPAGGSWQPAVRIDSENLGTGVGTVYPAMDSAGNLSLLWTQYNGTYTNLWGRTMRAGAWLAPGAKVRDGVNVSSVQITLAGSDNAVATWLELGTDGFYHLGASRKTTGAWSAATRIDAEALGTVTSPDAVIDQSGNATVVWEQNDGTRVNLWANRLEASSGLWGSARKLETQDDGGVIGHRTVVDSAGNVTTLWNQSDGTRYQLWTNRRPAAGDWGTAALLSTGEASSTGYDPSGTLRSAYEDLNSYLRAALDGAGVLTAVWRQLEGDRWDLWSARMSPSGTWGTPEKLPGLEGAVTRDLFLFMEGNVPVVIGNTYDGNTYALWGTDRR